MGKSSVDGDDVTREASLTVPFDRIVDDTVEGQFELGKGGVGI